VVIHSGCDEIKLGVLVYFRPFVAPYTSNRV
jgi:hypothetical protein